MRTPPPRPDGYPAIRATFGDPAPFVTDKPAWEGMILSTRRLPTALPYAYVAGAQVDRVRAHRLVVDELVAAFTDCLDAGVPLARLVYGGCYAWRAKRGSPRLSLHTWGIAVDLDPLNNPLGQPWRDDGTMLDRRIVETFQRRGWKWGDDYTRPDPMHWAWAVGA